MKITEIPFELELERDAGRTLGEHMSDVVRGIAVQAGMLPDDDFMDWERMALGVAWEEFAVKLHPEVLWQPGELSLEGLPMTPDGISYDDDGTLVVHEFKLTWKSSAKIPIESQWMWMAQIMCYCKAAGTVHAILHVYWVNGDYKYSGRTQRYKCYRLLFEQEEIDEIWAMISRARNTGKSEKARKGKKK